MAHKMGLIVIKQNTATPYDKKSYLNAPASIRDENYYWYSKTTSTIYSSSKYASGTPQPYKLSTTHYYVGKAGHSTSFTAAKSITDVYSTANGTDAWTKDVSVNAGYMSSITAPAPTTTYLTLEPFTLTVGDIVYTDGAITHYSDDIDANRTTSGFVGYIGNDSYTEKNNNGGKSHALVVCKSVGDTQLNGQIGWCLNPPVQKDEPTLTNITTLIQAKADASGYTNSLTFRDDTNYPAFYKSYHSLPTPPSTSKTNWFMGSIGQWIKVFLANGVSESELIFTDHYVTKAQASSVEFDKDGTFRANIYKFLNKSGGNTFGDENRIHDVFTSSEINETMCVTIHIYPNLYMGPNDTGYDTDSKRSSRRIIPFCAI